MKGKIYSVAVGSVIDYALVENGEVYEFKAISPPDREGYCTILWETRIPPYKRAIKKWKCRKFIERRDNAPFATWKELYTKK